MNETQFSIDVATDLFEGYVLRMFRSEFLRLDEAGDWPEITHADRVAAFERYEAENDARAYYLEEEFDENGEEIDEYDPYLWMRPVDEQEMLAGMRGLKALTKTSGLVKPGVRYVVNVGSVGRPREGSLPTYATLDDATLRIELVTLR